MVGIGVIGYGYWGPNLVRNFFELKGSEVRMVSDLLPNRLKTVSLRYPSLKTSLNYRDVIKDPGVDAVVVATPVFNHFEIGMEVLRSGKHLLLEKPLTLTSNESRRLIEEARERKCILMVDHTFVYTGAVRKIKELVDSGDLGKLYYYDSVRVNLGLFQHDVNVLWDLAVHDLSIMDYVLGREVKAVSANGIAHLPGGTEDVAYLTCFFEDDLIAHFHVNWLAPVKVRRTLVGGDKKMIVYDDLEPSEKIKVYDKGVTLTGNTDSLHKVMVGYRTGDMWAPQLSGKEALLTEAEEFIGCIETGRVPLTDGEAGLRVVKILEAAAKSVERQGVPVPLVV